MGNHAATYTVKTSNGRGLIWHLSWSKGRLECSFEARSPDIVPFALRFPFDPRITATTLLASDWEADGTPRLPLFSTCRTLGSCCSKWKASQFACEFSETMRHGRWTSWLRGDAVRDCL